MQRVILFEAMVSIYELRMLPPNEHVSTCLRRRDTFPLPRLGRGRPASLTEPPRHAKFNKGVDDR
jgi:hypothetical protein